VDELTSRASVTAELSLLRHCGYACLSGAIPNRMNMVFRWQTWLRGWHSPVLSRLASNDCPSNRMAVTMVYNETDSGLGLMAGHGHRPQKYDAIGYF